MAVDIATEWDLCLLQQPVDLPLDTLVQLDGTIPLRIKPKDYISLVLCTSRFGAWHVHAACCWRLVESRSAPCHFQIWGLQ